MSSINSFFVAPDDAAAATVLDGGPDRTFESVTYGNFDADLALLEWESLLTGHSFADLLEASASLDLSGEDDDALMIAVSRQLQDALSRADDAELAATARLWVDERAAEGESIDPELAREILTEVGRLSRTAEQRLYCWIS